MIQFFDEHPIWGLLIFAALLIVLCYFAWPSVEF